MKTLFKRHGKEENMIFAVDIGNSNIVIAVMDENKRVLSAKRIKTRKRAATKDFISEIESVFGMTEGYLLLENEIPMPREEIEGTVIASVVPEVTGKIRRAMESITEKEVLVVRNHIDPGLNIEMEMPTEKIGTDLLVDAAAAAEEHEGRIIVFDMGTSTTCSVVDNGTYIGTIIMPGVAISHEALAQKASQLPKVDFTAPERLVGKHTVESMQSGIIYANAAMIDGLIKRVEDFIGGTAVVIATGGIAGLIVPHCEREIIYEPDLLLKGLWYIYHKNSKVKV